MTKRMIVLFALILLLAACTPTSSVQPTEVVAETALPTETFTPEPLPTSTFTTLPPTATFTLEPTATPVPVKVNYIGSSYKWQVSSQFVLDVSPAVGKYYAISRAAGWDSIRYECAFDEVQLNQLVCKGPYVTTNIPVYIQLFNAETDEAIYNNQITFVKISATPTGMACEVEPQWNGAIPVHQLDQWCFAITCYQNGEFFYGDNYTCDSVWPFEWDFTHPLYTPEGN